MDSPPALRAGERTVATHSHYISAGKPSILSPASRDITSASTCRICAHVNTTTLKECAVGSRTRGFPRGVYVRTLDCLSAASMSRRRARTRTSFSGTPSRVSRALSGSWLSRRHWCRPLYRSVSPRVRSPSFLHVVVRLYIVIVNSDCSHNYCLLHIAKTGHLRCCL